MAYISLPRILYLQYWKNAKTAFDEDSDMLEA